MEQGDGCDLQIMGPDQCSARRQHRPQRGMVPSYIQIKFQHLKAGEQRLDKGRPPGADRLTRGAFDSMQQLRRGDGGDEQLLVAQRCAVVGEAQPTPLGGDQHRRI